MRHGAIILKHLLLIFCLTIPFAAKAQPRLNVAMTGADSVRLSWEDASGLFVIEQTQTLGVGTVWQSVVSNPVAQGATRTVTLPISNQTRFFRLRSSVGTLTKIASTSPAGGETGVAVTRETVFRLSAPLSPGAALPPGQLVADSTGRRILSRSEISTDRTSITLYYLENLPGGARVKVTFNGTGLTDQSGNPLDLDGDGQPGGSAILMFDTVNSTVLARTAMIGRVLASEKGPGGVDVPLRNVTITVDGLEESVRTLTAADGSFRLEPSPVGRFFVNVDGRTAVGSTYPGGAYYPLLGKAWEAVAGKTNNLAGGTGIIYLPLVAGGTLQSISVTQETRVTFPASVLTQMPELNGVEIMVPPNGLFSDNGTRGGLVGLAPVASDRLPEPLPAGLNHALDISIQTSGPQNFVGPVPAKFPNLPDPVTGVKLPPGAKTALWSFNHDTGQWEMQGSMTISPDGNFAVTDPGVGIRQPGWHGTSPGSDGGGGPGGPAPPCTPGGVLPEGTSSCGPNDCPDPSEAKRQQQICFADAAAAAMKCYEKCGSSGPITGWIKVFRTAYKCAKAAGCANQKVADAKKCMDQWDKCILGGGGSLHSLHSLPPGGDALTTMALEIIAEMILHGAIWEQIVAIMDLAPSYEELSPTQRTQFDALIQDLNARLGGVSPTEYFGQRLQTFSSLVLQSPLADEVYPPVAGYYTIEDLESGLVRRGRTEPRGYLNGLILRPNNPYRISLLLGPALNYYQNEFVSAGAGQTTRILYGEALILPNVDADGDGIPAAAEFVLGTRDDRADSDGDSVRDLQELKNHTNPLDGQPPFNGVIASLNTPGFAQDVAVSGNVALVADGSAGVAVVDVTDPLRPSLLSQRDTPGTAQAVALEGMKGVVADGTSGVAILNLTDTANPILAAQLNLGGDARALALDGNTAFVGLANGVIVAVDILVGAELSRVTLPSAPRIEDLGLRGDHLYAWAAGQLHTLSIASGQPVWLAAANGNAGGGSLGRRMRLSLGVDRAYGAYPSGVVVFDLANPAAPAFLQRRNTTQNGWKQLVPVLPGLGLAADGLNLVNDEPHEVSLYTLGADGTQLNFLSTFPTPGVSLALVVDRGLAFLADGAAGLQMINFLSADTAGVPPTLTLAANFSLEPPQIESGQTARLTALANDDVFVREVEFYLDGVLAETDRAWPFEYVFTPPSRTFSRTSFKLLVRAVDTAGNATSTPELTVQLLPDMTPPRVTSVAPGNDTVPEFVTTVAARFNEPLDFRTVTSARVKLTSAGADLLFGNADDQLLPGVVNYLDTGYSAVMEFAAPLPVGRYRFEISGVRDLAGNALATTLVSHFWIAPGGPDGDPDEDGLTNTEESLANTSPFAADTDGDGWADEVEVHDGRNPRDPASRPSFIVSNRPLVDLFLGNPVEILPPVPGPVVARPGVVVEILSASENVLPGPFVARPEVFVDILVSDELAAPGPWVAQPEVFVDIRVSDELVAPGPWVAQPEVTLEIGSATELVIPGPFFVRLGVDVFVNPVTEQAAAGPWLARPPVQISISK